MVECQKCGNKIGFLGKTYNWKEHQNICYSCYKNLLDRDTEEREKQKKMAFDTSIRNRELPDYNILGLNLVLQENEKTHYYTKTKLAEERSVRQYIGGGGKWIRGGMSESHGELREIDNGELILTNQRLVFKGYKRTIEYKLPKIVTVEKYNNAVNIGASNRSKSQFYLLDDPYTCSEYIKLAILLFQEKKDVQKRKTKSPSNALDILKVRYAKGEITLEQFQQMKKDLEK